MSYGWYWKCDTCFSRQKFLKELWGGKKPKDFVGEKLIDCAAPYFHLELLSNRIKEYRRCRKCDRWHCENDPIWQETQCDEQVPFEIPFCDKCGTSKQLFFKESQTDRVIFVKNAFCFPKRPSYLGRDSVFDPYFYTGSVHERDDYEGGRILSALYLTGKNAKNYGNYAPYFFLSGFPFDEFKIWLDRESYP